MTSALSAGAEAQMIARFNSTIVQALMIGVLPVPPSTMKYLWTAQRRKAEATQALLGDAY